MSMRLALLAARLFVVSGGLFGLAWGLIHQSARSGLVAGIVAGLVATVVQVVFTASLTGRRPDSLSPRQSEALTVATDPLTAHTRLTGGLASLKARITLSSPTEIRARTSVSGWSWGERIVVTLSDGAVGTHVEIKSLPLVPITVVDMGRNRRNIQHLISWLTEPAETEPPAANATGSDAG